MICPFCRNTRSVPDPNNEQNTVPCPDCAQAKEKAKREFIEALRNFSNAAVLLSQAWEQFEYASGDVVPNDLYPFEESFDETMLGILDFKADVESKWGMR